MPHSRQSPSEHYRTLVAYYRDMHVNGDAAAGIAPEAMFPGHSLPRHAATIGKLLRHFGAKTLLDYGSGKGLQYQVRPGCISEGDRSWDSIPAYWGATVTCYDAAFPGHSTLPTGTFDAVISTDVLEHCPEEDIEWIVDEMFGYATKFLFANVACMPAKKFLPNGENAHCTIHPYAWWDALSRRAAARHHNLPWLLVVAEPPPGDPYGNLTFRPAGPIKFKS